MVEMFITSVIAYIIVVLLITIGVSSLGIIYHLIQRREIPDKGIVVTLFSLGIVGYLLVLFLISMISHYDS